MKFSYGGDPANSRRDRVRLFIGDAKDMEELSLSDEEIDFFLSQTENDNFAAAKACKALVAKLIARGHPQKAELLRKTCEELRDAARRSAGPHVGVI